MDGAADLPCKKLNGRTPLEAAHKPNLDYFSKNGQLGLVYTVGKDIAPESDVAVFALLGYDPYKSFSGRGPLEAYGSGIKLGKNFLAFRTNFATAKGKQLIDRRAGRNLTTDEANALAKSVNKNVRLKCRFTFKSTIEHRGILVLYGKFSNKVSNVDPAYSKEGSFGIAKENPEMIVPECVALSKDAEEAAEIVNDFVNKSRIVLENHPINERRKSLRLFPANIILPRDAGNMLPKLKQKKKWLAIVGMPLEKGIAQLAGMDVIQVKLPKITSRDIYDHVYKSLHLTLRNAVKSLKSNWKRYDNFYVHIKETDIPGHDGLPLEKKKILEIIDREFFSQLKSLKDFKLIVTSDHSTPCNKKAHSADPVPLLAYGLGKKDNLSFSEKNSRKGSLKKIYGKEVLARFFKS